MLILGAGPVGLTLANLLGGYGISTVLADAGDKLIDYPRGVGLDDESLRTFQTAGVVDAVLPHTTPNHIMRMVNGKGQVLANVAPGAQDYGWSRRNGFIQPLVDAELLKGLSRFDHVDVQFSHTLLGYVDDADGVTATIELADGSQKTIRARYLVGMRRRPQHHPQVDGGELRGPVLADPVPGHRRPERSVGHAERLSGCGPGPPLRVHRAAARCPPLRVHDLRPRNRRAGRRPAVRPPVTGPARPRPGRAWTSSGNASTPCTPGSPGRSARATC